MTDRDRYIGVPAEQIPLPFLWRVVGETAGQGHPPTDHGDDYYAAVALEAIAMDRTFRMLRDNHVCQGPGCLGCTWGRGFQDSGPSERKPLYARLVHIDPEALPYDGRSDPPSASQTQAAAS